MQKSKIPLTFNLKPASTNTAKQSNKITQPQLLNDRRRLLRRSKSCTSLAVNVQTATQSTAGTSSKPIHKTVLKPIAVNQKLIPKTTTKRPALTTDDVPKPKVSKPVKIPPYDYKARYNFQVEKNAVLIQTAKDADAQINELKAKVDSYENLESDHLKLQNEFGELSRKVQHLEVDNATLKVNFELTKTQCDDLQMQLISIKKKNVKLEMKDEQNLALIKSLQGTQENLLKELRDLKKSHALLVTNHASKCSALKSIEEKYVTVVKDRDNLNSRLEITVSEKEVLEETLHLYKTTVQAQEDIRRSMHNKIQDLKGNIRVFCRVRPQLHQEVDKLLCNISYIDEEMLEIKKSKESISCINGKPADSKVEFSFDKVFPPETSQAEVFEELSQLVQSAFDGYHICIFAYGQTGSGKTYTMQGEEEEQYLGMIPRTVALIFNSMAKLKKLGWTFTIEASFLEIYNEVIRDLLNLDDRQQHDILYNEGKGVTVTNLNVKTVTSAEELREFMNLANKNRAVAVTNFNEHSSRSHAVTKITLTSKHKEMQKFYIGSLSLVDLAGSESAKTSSSERILETKNINKSLSTLGTVMMALQNKENHIPYRNSKLTYLLQSSLGGNSKTLMFVNIAPFEECFIESLNALRFAAKVKEVKITSKRNRKRLV